MKVAEEKLTAEDLKIAKYGDLNQGEKLVRSKQGTNPK